MTLTKEPESSGEFWQFLLPDGSGSRPPWLKFDFDRWQDEDGEEESKENGPQSDFEASSLINGFESSKNKFQEQYKELMAKYMDKAISPEEAIKRSLSKFFNFFVNYFTYMFSEYDDGHLFDGLQCLHATGSLIYSALLILWIFY